jgi:hypothetical protein
MTIVGESPEFKSVCKALSESAKIRDTRTAVLGVDRVHLNIDKINNAMNASVAFFNAHREEPDNEYITKCVFAPIIEYSKEPDSKYFILELNEYMTNVYGIKDGNKITYPFNKQLFGYFSSAKRSVARYLTEQHKDECEKFVQYLEDIDNVYRFTTYTEDGVSVECV